MPYRTRRVRLTSTWSRPQDLGIDRCPKDLDPERFPCSHDLGIGRSTWFEERGLRTIWNPRTPQTSGGERIRHALYLCLGAGTRYITRTRHRRGPFQPCSPSPTAFGFHGYLISTRKFPTVNIQKSNGQKIQSQPFDPNDDDASKAINELPQWESGVTWGFSGEMVCLVDRFKRTAWAPWRAASRGSC